VWEVCVQRLFLESHDATVGQGYHIGVFHAKLLKFGVFFKAFGMKILVWHFGIFFHFFFQSGNSVTHLHLEIER